MRGRLDAVLIAARVAPVTRHIGLLPTVIVTHTEPFHASKAIATLDYVSGGRAGVRIRVSASPDEARHFGRREFPALDLRKRDDPAGEPYASDAAVFTGTAGQLADLMQQWQQTGLTGFRLRPGAIPRPPRVWSRTPTRRRRN